MHEDTESHGHPLLTQCLNRSWSMPILNTSTEENHEDRLAVIGGGKAKSLNSRFTLLAKT